MKKLLILALLALMSCSKDKEECCVPGPDPFEPEVVGPTTGTRNMYEGSLSGSYGISGTYRYTEGIYETKSDYVAPNAPGPHIYLSNTSRGIEDSYYVGAVIKGDKGVLTYTLPKDIFNQYKYVVYWCQPFDVYIGGAQLF